MVLLLGEAGAFERRSGFVLIGFGFSYKVIESCEKFRLAYFGDNFYIPSTN